MNRRSWLWGALISVVGVLGFKSKAPAQESMKKSFDLSAVMNKGNYKAYETPRLLSLCIHPNSGFDANYKWGLVIFNGIIPNAPGFALWSMIGGDGMYVAPLEKMVEATPEQIRQWYNYKWEFRA